MKILRQFHLIFLIPAIFTAMIISLPFTAAAEEKVDESSEYVNPFYEENMQLYQEALKLKGHLYLGAAFLDHDDSESQASHYSPLLDGLVLGKSKITMRSTKGHEFGLSTFYDNEDNLYLGLRYLTGDLSLRGNVEFADYALIEDTPASIRTTTTDHRNFGFEVKLGDVLTDWEHRRVDRKWDLSGLSDYTSDRFAISFDTQVRGGNVDFDISYREIDSQQLLIDNQGIFATQVNSDLNVDHRTSMNFGYGGIFAQKPNAQSDEDYTRHVLSGAVSRRGVFGKGIGIGLFGNYQVLSREQTLNTHWDRNYDFGARIYSDWIKKFKFEAGATANYFDVDRLRYEMEQLDLVLLTPGLSVDDLERFMVRNYGHTYSGFVKAKMRLGKRGLFKQNLSLERHNDNKAPDGAEDTGVPGEPSLTLYNMWKSTTGLNAPVSKNTTFRLTNVFRKWDMRLRDSDGQNNLFTAAITWTPDDTGGFSVYYENMIQEFENPDVDPFAANQQGFGLDIWGSGGNSLDYTTGIFAGHGSGSSHSFDTRKIHATLNLGTDDRWRITLEYLDSDNDDYQTLDFDVFKAVLYYRIDL